MGPGECGQELVVRGLRGVDLLVSLVHCVHLPPTPLSLPHPIPPHRSLTLPTCPLPSPTASSRLCTSEREWRRGKERRKGEGGREEEEGHWQWGGQAGTMM
eukprot:1520776-Rhodomonas_salina.1